jgi:hypothetical protein
MFELLQLTTSKLPASGTGLHAGLREPPFAAALGEKTFLPKRNGEPRFAPRQYFYPASKSGVVPSLPIRAAISRFDEDSDVQRNAA